MGSSYHPQWDECGQLLWDKSRRSSNIHEYINKFDIH